MFPILTREEKSSASEAEPGDGEPKYLEFSESSVFLKKNNLYGLNLTKTRTLTAVTVPFSWKDIWTSSPVPSWHYKCSGLVGDRVD